MKKDYSIVQAELVHSAREKVAKLFQDYPVKGHNLDHAERVAEHAVVIAEGEGYKDVYLCELAGLVHDIGRAIEHYKAEKRKLSHHEFSYELLRAWFNEDDRFKILGREQKIALLYTVRYHWNNAADDYELAWILRDADKLDLFGEIGIQRITEYRNGDKEKIQQDMRFEYDCLYWIRTETAKRIIEEQKLMEPVNTFYKTFLKEQIKPIVL
ncbi:MAG: HD domain-containing protein [Candidatus Magasanikbacteria bacterium]|nr:HD domain-containing protein [Candidatus Magasanikbacteria bacterium]